MEACLMQPNELSSVPSVDAEYRFGRPKVYLAPHELARLILLRSKLGDTQADREANAAANLQSQSDCGHEVA
jgi:hypothetical protein